MLAPYLRKNIHIILKNENMKSQFWGRDSKQMKYLLLLKRKNLIENWVNLTILS